MCESFNDTILEARGKTILPMLEDIRVTLMLRWQKRRKAMRAYNGDICPNIRSRLNKRIDDVGSNCIAQWSRERIYQVNCFNGQQFTCDLATHTCSCRRWDLTGIPCPHGIAAIHECNEDVDEYVAHWFRKETYMANYEPIIYPLHGMDMWTPTRVIGPLPPNVKKQAGRPKKLRKRGNDEPRDTTTLKRRNTTTTCSQCGKLGHNKRSCKGQPIPRKQTARRSNLALGRNVGPESSRQATMGSTRGRQKSSSQPTMSTPTRRS
ncbi:hypothetical protein Vadar_020838 [Vaccinium darrowii]|uniref:Uncharacterized protein n=1 Tax=Vaccinium darrowii TaxID=229202 RepID=A0ACB7X2D7_9ERIC|nr:hypothetical protein Vadar_020838 [Vaccinium darrowii]